MKTRHLRKALVALLAMTAAIVTLPGHPAAANEAEITSGTLDLYAADETLMHTYVYGTSTSDQCSTNVDTVEVDSNGDWSATFTSHTSTVIASSNYLFEFDATLEGTSSTDGTLTGTGTGQARLFARDTACNKTTTSPCIIDAFGFDLVGTHTVEDHEIEASDTATISGDNGDPGDFGFEVSVTGTTCGVLVALSDGAVVLDSLVVHATT